MKRPRLSACFLSALLSTIALALFACEESGSPTRPKISPLPSTPEVRTTQGSNTTVATPYLAANSECAPASKPDKKQRICHRSGSKFKLKEVSKNAVPAHMAHGDVLPGTEGLDCNCQGDTQPEPEEPGIDIEKATNGQDADEPPGPTLNVGGPVTWTYVITNTSAVLLSNILVTDNQGVTVSCPESSLAAGESMTCTATGIVQAGQYANVGTVTATDDGGAEFSDSDPSHYFGGEVGDGQGCTPGYWKQRHHFDSWPEPFSPDLLFSEVFEDAVPGKTLREVLRKRGGGLNALGRHTVAALLNAAAAEVSFGLTSSEVISRFNDVFPGTKQEYNELKDSFEAFNEQGCPLN
jgi:hypothetical protein